jgi:TrmH family RNA methyltransferase
VPREITAFSNPLVKRVRSLRDKKHRRDEGLFLAEGLRILTEAREAGHLPTYLFFAKGHDGHPLAQELIAATEASGGEVIQTDSDILSKLSGKDNPGAVVGVYRELSTDLSRGPAVAGGGAAARSGQSRHNPAHRRCGRRGRADPRR